MNPSPLWKDYPGKSVLNLIFGQVSGEIFLLDTTNSIITYGVILHPYLAYELVNLTLDQAKINVEQVLTKMLTTALSRLS
jgi:hypothetical protein